MRDLGLKTWRWRSSPTTSICVRFGAARDRSSLAIQRFKGITARSLFAEFPPLRRVLRRGHLWAPSCSVGTAGRASAETIRRYIERAEHLRTRR